MLADCNAPVSLCVLDLCLQRVALSYVWRVVC